MGDQFIYAAYVGNILNLLKDFKNAELLLSNNLSDNQIKDFCDANFHLKTHIYLYKISQAFHLFHTGKKKECIAIFKNLSIENNDIMTFSFDSKIYFELQYYFLGQLLYSKREDFSKKFEILVNKTQFTKFKTIYAGHFSHDTRTY